MKSETGENWITYHHNWFDHSDSRHPRIRTMSVHVYNNYYDGNSKYGVGVTYGGNAFVEANYFRNCNYPVLVSMQGSDILSGETLSGENGGVVKAYGNYMTGQKSYITQKTTTDKQDIDVYEASSRDEKVPADYTAKKGETSYNNFDTNSDIMYSYTPDKAADVPAIVQAEAGRLGGGDFKYDFDDSKEDTDHDVNSELMSKLTSYKTAVIAIGSGFTSGDTPVLTTAVTTAAPSTQTTVKTTVKATDASQSATTKATAATTKTSGTAISIPVGDKTMYASPDGTGDGSSKDAPASLDKALAAIKANPGMTIYLLGGTYKLDSTILIEEANSGSAKAYNTIMAYPGETVVWDFSSMAVANSNRGVVLDGSYWHFKGFEIKGAGDNGMLLSGDNNVIEMMVFNDNQDTGLQISRYQSAYNSIDQWPSNNLILNCTSKNNCDNATMENADGFAAKLTCGEGNVFDGCMSYNNSDDGWDLFAKDATGPIGVVTIRNCIAFRNGYTESGEGYGNCDGNGFKLGGSGVGTAHIVENCLAFENLNCGFTDNNNPKLGSLTNCTAYNNGVGGNGKPNYSLYRCTDDGCDFSNIICYINQTELKNALAPNTSMKLANDKFVGTIQNSVYYNGKYYSVTDKQNIANGNKIGTNVTLTDADFVSVSAPKMGTDFHTVWRNADGTINTNGFMQTVTKGAYEKLGANFSAIDLPVVPVTSASTSASGSQTTETTVSTTVTILGTQPSTDVTSPSETVDPSTLMYGDVDLDKVVGATDVVLINKYLLSTEEYPLTNEDNNRAYSQADASYDGDINLNDSQAVIQKVLGIFTQADLGPQK